MITFLDLGRHGRLGNQLFQYAALRGIAEKLQIECKIPDYSLFCWHGQQCLLDCFNIKAKKLEYSDFFEVGATYHERDPNCFYEGFFSIPDGSGIKGFFQSLKYFEHCEELVKEELTPKKVYFDEAKKILSPYEGHEVVSVHVRRGDMINHMYDDTGIHPDTVFGKEDILDQKTIFGRYLVKAMDLFKNKDVKFLVFAGGKRDGDDSEDIDYIKRVCKDERFVFSDSNNPMIDFATIMSCDHNITCHQSSFGWWAAYLNKNEGKIVTSPKHYFLLMSEEENYQRTKEGHFPKDWIVIDE